MHYDNEREEELDLQDVDDSRYTKQMWFDEIKDYLVNVIGMNPEQVKKEFDTRFPELLERGLELTASDLEG